MKSFLQDWGFSCYADLWQSTLHYKSFKPLLFMSITLGGVSNFISNYVGLEPIIFAFFISLLLIEVVTGIRASVREGKKIESKRFSRFIFKVFIYTFMISMLNVMSLKFKGMMSNLYGTLFHIVFHYIMLHLTLSVFENMCRLGYRESSRVFNAVSKYLDKFFNLKIKDKE